MIEKSLLLKMAEKSFPGSPVIIPQIPTISLSQSPFSLSSPLLFSTPNAGALPTPEIPPTQEFLERLQKLRDDDVVIADEARPAFLAMQRETDELKSQLLAARLQLEEKEIEIRELREQLQAQPPPPPSDILQPVISKRKRKQIRKQHLTAAAAADTTQPPGCDSVQLPPPPSQRQPVPRQPPSSQQQQQPQNQQQRHPLPKLYVFHDSNLKNVTAAEINKYINNNNNKKYDINPQETFTLPQTFNKIQQTKFGPNDAVIINTLTNDARQTQTRNRRTPDQTRQLQTKIIQHLLQHIPRQNITILESPPLDSTTSDIFHYNHASVLLARKFQIRFADTLVGEQDLWKDGYHLLRSSRHLLVKSVAAAAAQFSPHQRFGLSRPPFGENGPWAAPKGQGVFPREFRQMAMAQPMSFRRCHVIPPLMGKNIQRPR